MVVMLAALTSCSSTTSSDGYSVTWSTPTVVDGQRTYDLDCGTVSGHPCSLITHATAAEIDGLTLTWSGFVGSDANGNDLATDHTFVDTVTIGSAGELELPARGDDGGLRLAASLPAAGDGWAGQVSWMLGSVAGTTTFDVTLSR